MASRRTGLRLKCTNGGMGYAPGISTRGMLGKGECLSVAQYSQVMYSRIGFFDETTSFQLNVHLTRTAVDRVVKNLRLPVKGPTRGVTASQQKPRQSQTARAERRPPRAQEVEDEGWQKVRRRSHRTSTPPRGNTQCYFCGESGHVKDSCRHGHRVECNTCGGLGHKAKFCTR